jgi:glycosyltransferase involved in cell wall biosynthesis
LYSKRRAGGLNILKAYWRRLCDACKADGLWLVEYELFPFLPYFFEKFFLKKHKYILNFDDNVWEKYRNRIWLSGKYDKLCRNAAGIIVANDFLFDKVSKLNSNIVKIPTVVDLDLYRCDKLKFDKFTLAWIGTPVTYIYLQKFTSIFRMLSEKYDFELLVVARKSLEYRRIQGVNMRFENWSQERETDLLPRCHVGIMPLTNDEFSKGKSAFKLIQYLASGLPVIASPVGENVNVVEAGKNGFLADSAEDWLEALKRLMEDDKLYSSMAQEARNSAGNYSIQKYFPVFREFIEKIQ